MLHKFKIPVFEEGERSLKQECLTCGIPSIVYKPRSRFYYNGAGKVTKNAPQCSEPRILHNFEKIPIPEGEKEVIQTCKDCGKKRVVYLSGFYAYFDELTGARMPYVTACTPIRDAKVICINDFVKTNQLDSKAFHQMGKFIEAIFILKSIQHDGLTDRTLSMVDAFMNSQEHNSKQVLNGNDMDTGCAKRAL